MFARRGLGCMGRSDVYGPSDRGEGLATLAMAVERGITLLDTGDFYGMGHNEMLIGEALKTLDRDKLTLSVKFGGMRGPGGEWSGFDGRPAAVKNFRSEEHTSELQSLMRNSYAVFCLKKKKQ